jgi:hypothetical protein
MISMPSTEPFFSAAKILREVDFGGRTPLDELDLEMPSHALDVARQPRCDGVGGIGEDEQSPEPDHFPEDLEALVLKLPQVVRDARQVAAGSRHTLDKAGADRIAHVSEDHRDL